MEYVDNMMMMMRPPELQRTPTEHKKQVDEENLINYEVKKQLWNYSKCRNAYEKVGIFHSCFIF